MAEDLRHRIAEALAATCRLHETVGGCARCERRLATVMAVRDEELERLRRQAGWHGQCVPLTKWAEELRDKLNAAGQREQAVNDGRTALAECNEWRERAETAEAAIARVRQLRDVFEVNARTIDGVAGRNFFELFVEELDAALDYQESPTVAETEEET